MSAAVSMPAAQYCAPRGTRGRGTHPLRRTEEGQGRSFPHRVVLTGQLGSFWATKTIPELNERVSALSGWGMGASCIFRTSVKSGELSDDERRKIGERYDLDASGFRTQVSLQGAERAKLARLSMAEFRAAGLALVESGPGETVVASNIKFFGPFGTEDQERLAASREGIDAEKFVSKITLAWGLAPVLSVRSLEALRAACAASISAMTVMCRPITSCRTRSRPLRKTINPRWPRRAMPSSGRGSRVWA